MATLESLGRKLEAVSYHGLPVVFGGEELYARYGHKALAAGRDDPWPLLVPEPWVESYRGFYERPALVPRGVRRLDEAPSVSEVLYVVVNAQGTTVTGWKGGEYVLTGRHGVYVAEAGDATQIGVLDVVEVEDKVILVTYGIGEY